MANFRVQVTGLDEYVEAMRRVPEVARKEVSEAVAKSVQLASANVTKEAPVNRQTGGGNLRQRIRARMSGRFTGIIESLAPYSVWVHDGTDPHLIRPRNKMALANTRTGQFFGKLVRHPGTQPNPFFVRGLQRSLKSIDALFEAAVDRIVKAAMR